MSYSSQSPSSQSQNTLRRRKSVKKGVTFTGPKKKIFKESAKESITRGLNRFYNPIVQKFQKIYTQDNNKRKYGLGNQFHNLLMQLDDDKDISDIGYNLVKYLTDKNAMKISEARYDILENKIKKNKFGRKDGIFGKNSSYENSIEKVKNFAQETKDVRKVDDAYVVLRNRTSGDERH